MPTPKRPLLLVSAFVGLLLLVVAGGYGIVRGASRALSKTRSQPVDVAVALTVLPDGVHVRADLTGTGLTALRPGLASRDTGYVLNASERTNGALLRYTKIVTQLAADGSSARLDYEVQGNVVYPLPVAPGLSARQLSVTISGGRIGSCLTAYGTSNGTPRLRPCATDAGAPLVLSRDRNGLERVRLTVAR